MQPVKFDGMTHTLGKPADWDDKADGDCVALPVRIEPRGPVMTFASVWELDATELAILKAGGRLQLVVMGQRHPPVELTVLWPRPAPDKVNA